MQNIERGRQPAEGDREEEPGSKTTQSGELDVLRTLNREGRSRQSDHSRESKKNEDVRIFFEKFNEKYDEIQQSFESVKDPQTRSQLAKGLDTIRRLLRTVDNPYEVFSDAIEELHKEVEKSGKEVSKFNTKEKLTYLWEFKNKIENKINRCKNEYTREEIEHFLERGRLREEGDREEGPGSKTTQSGELDVLHDLNHGGLSRQSDHSRESKTEEFPEWSFLYGQGISGDRSHDTHSEKGEGGGSGTENTTDNQRIKVENDRFMLEQERARDPIDALINFLQDAKYEDVRIFFEDFDKKYDKMQQSYESVKDPKTRSQLAKCLDTIRRQLRIVDNPDEVFSYATEKLRKELGHKIGEFNDEDKLKYLGRFQGKINEYVLNKHMSKIEHFRNRPQALLSRTRPVERAKLTIRLMQGSKVSGYRAFSLAENAAALQATRRYGRHPNPSRFLATPKLPSGIQSSLLPIRAPW